MTKIRKYDKLVRDGYIKMLDELGKKYSCKIGADDEEFKKYLGNKVVEVAYGLDLALTMSKHQVKIEIAELLEVIEYIKEIYGLTDEEIQEFAAHRREVKGSFDKRIILYHTVDEYE